MCCAMYSSTRFRANKIAITRSCRIMSITSFLSEGEKTCSLRSRKEATATGRQCLHPTESAGYKRFLPCVCRNKAVCASLLGVSKAARNRDSSIIQITAADVNPLSAKKDNLSGDPSPKPKKLPCAVIAEEVCKKLLQTKSAVAARGSSWERGLGRGRPPTKGGRPLPKVFLPVRPRFAFYAIALIFLVNWLFL